MKKVRTIAAWIVPLSVAVVFAVVALLGGTSILELKVRDFYTVFVPPPPKKPQVVLLDADDAAIQRVGQWPWSRDVHADLLVQLRSLGTQSLSFDIEFVDPGVRGLGNGRREAVLAAKTGELDDVFRALKDKQISAAEASDYARQLLGESVALTARDNDQVLGRALKLFGNAYVTLNYDSTLAAFAGSAPAEAAFDYLKGHFAVGPVTGDLGRLPAVESFRGAIVPIAEGAAGAAVTNVLKDPDGTLRRMNLLFRLSGTDLVFGQFAFVPLWNAFGRPAVEVASDRIVLRTSALKTHPQPDVVIPLDPQGRLVINWPHAEYKDSFRHVGVTDLQDLETAWSDTAKGLKPQVLAMQQAGYFDEDFEASLKEIEAARDQAVAEGDGAAFDAAEAQLAQWRQAVAAVVTGPQAARLRTALREQQDDPKLSAKLKAQIPEALTAVDQGFANLKNKLQAYQAKRTGLEAALKGAFVVYGWTSAATTDLGVTPFDPKYYNPGVHAAIINTVLSGAYLNEWPLWASFLLGLGLMLAAYLGQNRLGTLTGVLAGFVLVAGFLIGAGLFYAASGVYVGVFLPGLMVFATVLGLTLLKFWGAETDRRYIRQAFGTYLSPEVIKQLEADPDRLNLGGEKKVLTAMFTDVKGFSTFSEAMDPNELVALLNRYLTRMSDLILDESGTIDKFEGDAIIAFWGAPLPFDDHAPRAVRAALQMKAAEDELNRQLMADGVVKSPLLTRIGLNTGEMTVGNMGTARRMDYTMMGNSVNLAARLEGVNKQYGTWILTTDFTRQGAGEGFLFRKLDQVRVVGISTPIRLHEVVSFRSEASDRLREKVALFEQGVDVYEARDWTAAQQTFETVLRLDPADGPAKTFLERTEKNRRDGLDQSWDGVYNLTTK